MDIVNLWINGCKVIINKDKKYKQRVVPIMICNDGFEMSIQASPTHYCIPKTDKGENYIDYFDYNDTHIIHTHFEIGFPNNKESLLMNYAEDNQYPCGTVYPYVPLDVVLKVINKHKGLNLKEMVNRKVKQKNFGLSEFDYKSDEDLKKRFMDMILIEVI